MQQQISVSLQYCEGYDASILRQFFDLCFSDVLPGSLRSNKILVKPNLISAKRTGPATTDPRFMVALADYFIDRGARVAFGDSPAFGSARGVMRGIGVEKELEKRGVKILDFTEVTKKKLQCGVQVGIATEALDCDYFINAPKLKAHNQMYVTLAVKNIFGIVRGMQKSMLHMRFGGPDEMFSQIILDLVSVLPKNFTCVDGIVAMNKGGPIHGERLNFGCIAFAEDPVAVDTALLAALRLSPGRSPLWSEARRRGYRSAALANIDFPLLPPEYFHKVLFQPPVAMSPIRFNPIRFLWGNVRRAGLRIFGKSSS